VYRLHIVACRPVARKWPVRTQQMKASLPPWRHATMEEILQAVFSVDPVRGYITRPSKFSSVSECSAVEYSGMKWVGWWAVRVLLQFSRCELLLLEVGSWGTGTVREHWGKGTPAVGSCYQATTGEDTADWEDLVRAVVNCRECELTIAL
jgi:hypothetical protein